MKAVGLNHIGVTVGDFQKAVSWYHHCFGCYLISQMELKEEKIKELETLYELENTSVKLGFLRLPGGGVIEIFQFIPQVEEVAKVWNAPGLTHFTMDVRNIDKWYKRLKNLGVNILCDPQRNNGVDWFFIKDPWGNRIELMDMHMNYRANKWFGGLLGVLLKRKSYATYYKE